MRLLIAEDDPRLLRSLLHIFKKNGYDADGVENGREAYDLAKSGEYDGLVLDVMMPAEDGISLLKRLRGEGVRTPALFLTARTEVSDRVAGLDAGADDYLGKPFSTEELLARVRAILRRRDSFSPDLTELCGVVLNASAFTVSYGGRTESLGGKELRILEMLMQNRGAILSVDRLITHIWGWDSSAESGVVWVHISNLRRKLERLGAPLSVRFVRGVGYVIETEGEKR